jgi:hypothetical protein
MEEKKITADKGFNKDKTPRLNPIPANTVVHAPTEKEAKELLAILYDNGYKWKSSGSMTDTHGDGTIYNLNINERTDERAYEHCVSLTTASGISLADFKHLYCVEEKPQPKFKPGDKVKISVPTSEFLNKYNGTITYVLERQMRGDGVEGWLTELSTAYVFKDEWLEPYTEPETKLTKDKETKGKHNLSQNSAEKCDNNDAISTDEKKELNLCELLKGHEGEYLYVPICGTEIELKKIRNTFIVFNLDKEEGCTIECNRKGQQCIGTIDDCGKFSVISYPNGHCMVYPSRALYEQYPLDPYTAWMKWKEEQRTYEINISIDYCENFMGVVDATTLTFQTPADRDKCIEEINAVIKKYNKK